jgi:hypothetical protein
MNAAMAANLLVGRARAPRGPGPAFWFLLGLVVGMLLIELTLRL